MFNRRRDKSSPCKRACRRSVATFCSTAILELSYGTASTASGERKGRVRRKAREAFGILQYGLVSWIGSGRKGSIANAAWRHGRVLGDSAPADFGFSDSVNVFMFRRAASSGVVRRTSIFIEPTR